MKSDSPTPLRRKLLLSILTGLGCLAVGIVMFFVLKDHSFLLLSLFVLAFFVCKTAYYYHILATKSYDVVYGTCTAVIPTLRRYCKVRLLDTEGNEFSLLLDKHAKIQIDHQYQFYFKATSRLCFGHSNLDSALNSDCFLGFEEVDVPCDKKI